jgi:imidazolonepropionase-like amidohydrolase
MRKSATYQTIVLLSKIILLLSATVAGQNIGSSENAKNAENPIVLNRTYEFANGNWFDGKGFRRKVFYSINGFFSEKRPTKVDETLDLKGGYVVPPFADAHTHHFDSPRLIDQQIAIYLRDGVFYAKTQGNLRSGALKVADKVNVPTNVDVAYAHGTLTRTFGHGLEIFETMALGLVPMTSVIEANKARIAASRLRENDAYYIIDSAKDLDEKWKQILAGKPDFLKIYLLHSEKFKETLEKIPDIKLGHIGLDPSLVPLIVKRAHAAGLRVSAHVESAADYRVALRAGVDEMAHLPGYYFTLDEDPAIYQLTEKDVTDTAKHRTWVIPTPNLPDSFEDKTLLKKVEDVAKHNLKLLKRENARIAFGADSYMSTPVKYVLYIGKLGIFTNLEMLKIWCEDTPQTIFRNRKIGRLRKDYEASFLVLDKNPLEDLEAVKGIRLRFKQGHIIGTK